MDIVSTVKYARISPKKLRALSGRLAKQPIPRVETQLMLTGSKGAKLLLDAIRTAIADAVNNYKKNKDELVVKTVQILEATKMKRFQPVSRGIAHGYVKKMSHIRVVLTDNPKKQKSTG